MKVALGSDHRGFKHKKYIQEQLQEIVWFDFGTWNEERSDYPLFAQLVCKELLAKTVDAGILLCGSGVGMSIAANRYRKIYAALVWNEKVAACSKTHNAANIVIIPADFVSCEESISIIQAWLKAPDCDERHKVRLSMLD